MAKRLDFVNSLKQMSEADLKGRIEEDKMRLKKLKFAHSVSPIENPMVFRDLRKDVARAETELQKRKLEAKSDNTTGSATQPEPAKQTENK